MKSFKDNPGRATFLAGNGNPDRKPVGPPSNRNIQLKSKSAGDGSSGAGGGRIGGGIFNDNAILDTSQVERGKFLKNAAIERRLASNRGVNKGNC